MISCRLIDDRRNVVLRPDGTILIMAFITFVMFVDVFRAIARKIIMNGTNEIIRK